MGKCRTKGCKWDTEGDLAYCDMCVLKAGGHLHGVPGKGKKVADAMNRATRREKTKEKFFLCGGCDHFHPFGWTGDCRNDAMRLTEDELDLRHGQAWKEVDETTGEDN